MEVDSSGVEIGADGGLEVIASEALSLDWTVELDEEDADEETGGGGTLASPVLKRALEVSCRVGVTVMDWGPDDELDESCSLVVEKTSDVEDDSDWDLIMLLNQDDMSGN